ncbi:MAG: response regulator [Deltaproteobacteria bacterium]|nr:response regulator [Deltaproteobacteria bacterium]
MIDAKTVLIIDYDPASLAVLTDVLRDLTSTDPLICSGVAEAHDLLEARPVDALVCSVATATGSGLDFLTRIREDPGLQALPVVLLAGPSDRSRQAILERHGPTAIIFRPVSRRAVQEAFSTFWPGLAGAKIPSKTDWTGKVMARAADLIKADRLNHAMIYLQGLAEKGENPEVLGQIGLVRIKQGRCGEALEPLSRASVLAPSSTRFQEALALVFRRLGRIPEAVDALKKAARLHLEAADLDEARRLAQELDLITPDSGEGANILGAVLRRRGRLSEALETFAQAVKLAPKNAVFHCNLGRAALESRDLTRAEACFQQALALDPDLAEARDMLLALNFGKIP